MTVSVNPTMFRAYDIRGVVDRDLSEDVYQVLGRASGTFFRRYGRRRIVVARDARLTSPAYAAALAGGLRRAGCDVIDIGMAPTPLMYFAVSFLRADGGTVVTASHNPPQFNGLKLRLSDPVYGGTPLDSDQIQEIGRIATSGEFADGDGAYERHDVADDYVHDVASHFSLERPVRLVLDGGNGVAGPLGVRTFEAIGCTVTPLFIEPDGTFPNHHPDPLKEENLQDLIRTVRATGADIGIGLDGDGDRLGVVDGNGEVVFADRYMIVLARQALARGPAPIVFDVKCSALLADAVRSFGGTPIMWKTGYTNQSARMREVGAPLAGELSGHVFGAVAHHYHDDGIFAGCMLLDALARSGQTLAEALAPYPVWPSLSEGRLPFDEDAKFKAIAFVRDHFAARYPVIDVDGVRVDFGDGWGVLRASNTEPAITTRFEARTMERVYEIRDVMIGKLREYASPVQSAL
ncbi:MAG: phosphomannomutase/phosphoglucomutase [Chloroflexi bacterium]|nr:phosphomannomutase/phosphoglucomutase [Chloroflexota bacterium]